MVEVLEEVIKEPILPVMNGKKVVDENEFQNTLKIFTGLTKNTPAEYRKMILGRLDDLGSRAIEATQHALKENPTTSQEEVDAYNESVETYREDGLNNGVIKQLMDLGIRKKRKAETSNGGAHIADVHFEDAPNELPSRITTEQTTEAKQRRPQYYTFQSQIVHRNIFKRATDAVLDMPSDIREWHAKRKARKHWLGKPSIWQRVGDAFSDLPSYVNERRAKRRGQRYWRGQSTPGQKIVDYVSDVGYVGKEKIRNNVQKVKASSETLRDVWHTAGAKLSSGTYSLTTRYKKLLESYDNRPAREKRKVVLASLGLLALAGAGVGVYAGMKTGHGSHSLLLETIQKKKPTTHGSILQPRLRAAGGNAQLYVNPKRVDSQFVSQIYERREGMQRGLTDMTHAAQLAVKNHYLSVHYPDPSNSNLFWYEVTHKGAEKFARGATGSSRALDVMRVLSHYGRVTILPR